MKKIMFSKEYGMEQAVLERLKTMTRRLVQLPDGLTRGDLWNPQMGIDDNGRVHFVFDCIDGKQRDFYPQYQIGEVVAVAQSYHDLNKAGYVAPEWCEHTCEDSAGYENKMFVRADLMPHNIRITDIGIEPLQDISDEDYRKEGIMEGEFTNTWDTFYYDHWGDVPNHITFRTPRQAFASLIDKISGKGTWQKNPWVFAYEFELVQ